MYFQRVFVLFWGEITILFIQMGYLHLIAEKTSDCSLVSDSSTPLGQNCDVPDAANLNCVHAAHHRRDRIGKEEFCDRLLLPIGAVP